MRTLLSLFFDWQIGRKQAFVEDLQKQRETKINELKKATKYDSTQELLQKYGAAPRQTPSKAQQGTKRKIATPQDQQQRTGLPPPPTANIVRPGVGVPNTPQRQTPASPLSDGLSRSPQSSHSLTTSPVGVYTDAPGFAPNAFSTGIPPLKSAYDRPSNWYDRILDVILGDDETLAKNRLALICSNCRLVNGQAPPGLQTLEQVGIWRCSSCGSQNGVESEAKKMVKELAEKAKDKDEDWRQTSRGSGSSPTDLSKQIDGSVEDESKDGTKDSEDDDGLSGTEDTSRGIGTGREADSEGDGQGVAKRVTRSSKKKYDDEDQGW